MYLITRKFFFHSLEEGYGQILLAISGEEVLKHYS